MTIRFHPAQDWRTDYCKHEQHQGCKYCCIHCDMDNHACGGCGVYLNHTACGHTKLGTCTDCRAVYLTDTPETT